MALLVFLCQNAGQVVTREEIEAKVWQNRVVSYDVVTNAIVKIRKALEDDPKHPRIIETLSKKGYRMLAPVSCIDSANDANFTSVPDKSGRRGKLKPRKYYLLFLSIALSGIVAVTLVFNLVNTPEKNTQRYASKTIVVLPFTNLTSYKDNEYVVDGITDDLITRLAMTQQLRVISRDSSFYYKTGVNDLKRIAVLLNVRYVIHGGVFREGDSLRINAKLIDTETSEHLLTQQFDGGIDDIFRFEDSIVRGVLEKLAIKGSVGDRQDLGTPQTKSPFAYEHFLKGRYLFYKYLSKDENRKARVLFEKSIADDPRFALAYAMLSWTYVFDVMNGWSANQEQSLQTAIDYAQQAIKLEPALPVAYFVSGLAYRQRGEYVKAMVEVEKAIEYDPNYANAHVLYATLLYYAGRPEEGLERIEDAIKLNPHHPYNYTFHLGQAYYVLGRYKDAITTFKKGLESNPASERLHVWLAAAYAQQGAALEAEWESQTVLSLNPEFSVERMRKAFPFKDTDDREHFIQGLVKAGLPN